MRVLVTRPEPDATPFAERCRSAGLTPIISPLMSIAFNKTPINTAGIGALAFTSANGARAFSTAGNLSDLPVFAIGDATAESANAAGFNDVSVAAGDIESLASLIEQERHRLTGAILHVAGAHRAGDLVNGLKLKGIEVRREVLYEARAVDALPEKARLALVSTPPVEWVSFFSPRTAKLFLALIRKAGIEDCLRSTHAVCLSEAIADVLAQSIWNSVEIAPRRDASGIISVITRHAQ